MAPPKKDRNTDPLFEIRPNASAVVLGTERSAQLDFEIRYLGSDAPPAVEARLVVTPARNWRQSLVFWRRRVALMAPAQLSWLDLPGLRLHDSLLSKDQTATLTVFIRVPADVQPGDYGFRLVLVDERERTLAESQMVALQVRSQPFSIQVIEPGRKHFSLNWKRQKDCQFQVYNTSGAPLQGRARLTPHPIKTPPRLFRPPGRNLDVSWLHLDDTAEQDYVFPDKNGHTYQVRLQAPRRTLPGIYGFSLDMAEADNPDENFTPGPVITFSVLAFPWALVTTLAALMVVCVGIWMLTRPNLVPEITPEQASEEATNFTVVAGDLFTYTLTITNKKGLLIGRRVASKNDFKDLVLTLDKGVTFVLPEKDSKKACQVDGSTINPPSEIEQIRPGGSITCTLVTQIDPSLSGVLNHTLRLGKRPPKTYTVNVSRESKLNYTLVPVEPVVEQDETQEPYLPVVGQDETLIYQLKVMNEGPSQSDPVILDFEPNLPDGIDFLAMMVPSNIECKDNGQANCCEVNSLVNCRWDYLEPGDQNAKTIPITIVPGPDSIGVVSNTITLTGTNTISPVVGIEQFIVSSEHGLIASLTATDEPKIDEELTYFIGIRNDLGFTANNLHVDFKVPDQITETVTLPEIAVIGPFKHTITETIMLPKGSVYVPFEIITRILPVQTIAEVVKDGHDPVVCWHYQSPPKEIWLHCIVNELDNEQELRIPVVVQPRQAGVYNSRVEVVDSIGFHTEDPLSMLVAHEVDRDNALRLDGTNVLSVDLSGIAEIREKLAKIFQAEVGFYYDGNTEGRILGIGDTMSDNGHEPEWSPGWSIDVQSGILTLRVRPEGNNQPLYRRCILSTPGLSGAGWYTVTMTVSETLAISSSLQASDGEERQCISSNALTNTITSTIQYPPVEPLTLMIGGNDGSSRKNYQGAIIFVKLSDRNKEIWEPLSSWNFGNHIGEKKIPNAEDSDNNTAFNLPAGIWAWVPTDGPVLMPVQITSDSTWKGYFSATGDWLKLDFDDDNWFYAWDMPPHPNWKPKTDALWIWAAQPYKNAGSKSTSYGCGLFNLATCCHDCQYDGFPATGIVYLRRVIDFPGNPVIATTTIWADDSCSLYVNGSAQGVCARFNEENPPTIELHNLVEGPNVIAIEAFNNGGPAGVLVIIKIDFYDHIYECSEEDKDKCKPMIPSN